MNRQATPDADRRLLLAFYADQEQAQRALETLIDQDYPLDRISMLGSASSSGDDPLGVYYPTPTERMRAWGGMGAFWGGLWGLLSGAAGMFLIPGVGPIFAAGPIVNTLIGGAAGAGLGAGVMAGSAATSHLAVTAHRMGVPDDRLDQIHHLLGEGHQMLLLIVGDDELGRWRDAIAATDPEPLWSFPYVGVVEGLQEAAAQR